MKRRSFLQLALAACGLAPLLPSKPINPMKVVSAGTAVLDSLPVASMGCAGAVGPVCPVGHVTPFLGTVIPAGWLPCDGREIPEDSALRQLMGEPFKLPDMTAMKMVSDHPQVCSEMQYIIKT